MDNSRKYNERLKADALTRIRAVADLRRRGMTYREIGEVYGISRQRAEQLYSRWRLRYGKA
jgi:transposase